MPILNKIILENIEIVLDKLILETMNGNLIWSSLDVFQMEQEIASKQQVLATLNITHDSIQKAIAKDIKFLALRELSQEEISNAIQPKKGRLRELQRRMKFIVQTSKRLEKVISNFKPEESNGWVIKTKIKNLYSSRTEVPAIFFVWNAPRENEFYFDFSIGNSISGDRSNESINSDNLPMLVTLGVLLRNPKRLNNKLQTIHSLDFGNSQ